MGESRQSAPGGIAGPASSTDNAIARYDGTTGKKIQDYTSGAPTINDTGNVTFLTYVTFNTGNYYVRLNDNAFLTFGSAAGNPILSWVTADADANLLLLALSTGDATDVPVLLLTDKTSIARATDAGAAGLDFAGTTQPTIAIADADGDSSVELTFSADDQPAIQLKGSATTLTLPTINTKLDDLQAPDDTTDLDFSTSLHGLVPKGTDAGNFLKDDGTWAAPAGGGDVTGPASSTDNEIARQHSTTGKILQTYTSNPPTISDTGDVNIDGDLDVENIVVSGNVDGKDVSGLATAAESVAAAEAAGLTLADAKAIEYTTPSADHTASGTIKTKTAGAALVFGDACYTGTDGKMEKALADDAAVTIPATHLCIATIAENAAGLFLEQGEAHDDSWAFDVGLSVYLSKDTAGLITKTMPTKATGNQVQVLGTCVVDTTTMFWNPSMIVMEYA